MKYLADNSGLGRITIIDKLNKVIEL